MCGITGIVQFESSEYQINQKILKPMTDVITHRGPDSDGIWISPNADAGFGFRRLAIIDLSDAGNQPMTTQDGRFTIVFNGEIYNHNDIRQDLLARGYKYNSQTDTETILYGFQEFGIEILNKMVGMWGIAIWDNLNKELFLARDRIGIKPLYYYYQNNHLIFGSEIKSILKHPIVKRELNLDELPNYLNFGMSSRNSSLFKNINKLPAGHFIKVNKKNFVQKRYWSPIKENMVYTTMNDKEIQEHILILLRQAIKDRMMSDVPFGVFLSGGIDSSVNVALMAELMDRPIDTYTVGFKELEKYNELEYARKISNLFKTNHHEILIDQDDALPILEQLAWHEDEPNADPVCIPLYFLSKLTRESGTTVIQVGEGSDEQFIGYPWMLRDYKFFQSYWKYYNFLPDSIKKSCYFISSPFFKLFNQNQALDYLRRASYNEELYWSGASIFPPVLLEKLFSNNKRQLSIIPAIYAKSLHNEILSKSNNADYLQRILYVELQNRLAEILLMRVDKIGMAHSLEARVPFLDHRFVEFTMSIPPNKKVPEPNTTKYILKKAINGIIPDEIIYRKKQGFWAPVNEWLRNDWYNFALDKVIQSDLMKQDIFNTKYIKKLFLSHHSGKANNGLAIFTLLMLSLWYEKFFENSNN